ncbi:hypothetical protein [Pelagicoccus sp. SDUM812005]|uniref:hypothetical protein n=1 Tax=Pelagicoccus sp. SDUM812005 TaxID=3041257 RepID=UPI00281259D8|nr:hypothetical protein [Pelagicoccus sp. SDUM812005]
MTFEKRNPYVGLAYFSDANDGGPDVCGTLDQKDKAFSKLLVVGKEGCEIKFHNSDDTDHNIFANDLESGVNFDVGLIPPGGDSSTVVNWNAGRLVRVGCKIHPKMVSYIANLPTSRYAIVEFEEGQLETRFAVADVDDSSVAFELVLQPLDRISVSIASGETKTVDVTYKGKVFGTLTLTR